MSIENFFQNPKFQILPARPVPDQSVFAFKAAPYCVRTIVEKTAKH
jgi:hypothetical protein